MNQPAGDMGKQVERRHYPRISTEIPVEIRRGGTTRVQAVISDLSSHGMQVSCARSEAERFDANGQQFEVEAHFTVPLAGGDAEVAAQCKLVFARRIAADRYCIGLNFLDMEELSYTHLARFMESCLD